MRLTIEQKPLETALKALKRVVPPKTTMPILRTVNISASVESQGIDLTTTDLEQVLSIHLNSGTCKIEESGKSLVPHAKLLEIVSPLDKARPVEFTTSENTVVREADSGKRFDPDYKMNVVSNGGYSVISGDDPNLFPLIPSFPTETLTTIPVETLLTGLNKVLFAAATDELRPVLNGILFHLKNGMFRLVATDGHRLSSYCDMSQRHSVNSKEYRESKDKEQTLTTILKPGHFQKLSGFWIPDRVETKTFKLDYHELQFIVPKATLENLAKLVDKRGEPVEVALMNNQIWFRQGNFTLASRLIEGRFPMYESVMPYHNPFLFKYDRDEMLQAVKQVVPSASSLTKHIRLELSHDKIIVSAEDSEGVSRTTRTVDCQYIGEELTIGYNGRFLIQVLEHLEPGTINGRISGPSGACLIRSDESPKIYSHIILLMPVRLN